MDQPLTAIERARAATERALSPGYSHCGRCLRPWSVVKGHCTPYSEGRGCFPLCESCWAMLTPEERLPYYKALWCSRDSTDVPWEAMRAACLFEQAPLYVDSWEEGNRLMNVEPNRWRSLIGASDGIYLEPFLPEQVVAAWNEAEMEMPPMAQMRIVFRPKKDE